MGHLEPIEQCPHLGSPRHRVQGGAAPQTAEYTTVTFGAPA